MLVAEARPGNSPSRARRDAPPIDLVRVSVPARLHVGFVDLNGGLGRRFGSLGIALDTHIPETVKAIRETNDVVKGMRTFAEWAVTDFQVIVQDTKLAGDGVERIFATDEAISYFHELGIGLVKGLVDKPILDQLTVIAESEQLRNQRPEDIVRIHMRVNENGMEWQTLQRDDGTIERKLVSE